VETTRSPRAPGGIASGGTPGNPGHDRSGTRWNWLETERPEPRKPRPPNSGKAASRLHPRVPALPHPASIFRSPGAARSSLSSSRAAPGKLQPAGFGRRSRGGHPASPSLGVAPPLPLARCCSPAARAPGAPKSAKPDQEQGLVIELHLRCAPDLSPPPGAGTRLRSARPSRPADPAPPLAFARCGRPLRERAGRPKSYIPQQSPRHTSSRKPKPPAVWVQSKSAVCQQGSPGHRLSRRSGPSRAPGRLRRPAPRSELRSSRGSSCSATPGGVCAGGKACLRPKSNAGTADGGGGVGGALPAQRGKSCRPLRGLRCCSRLRLAGVQPASLRLARGTARVSRQSRFRLYRVSRKRASG